MKVTPTDLPDVLGAKFTLLGALALAEPEPVIERFRAVSMCDAAALRALHDFTLLDRGRFD